MGGRSQGENRRSARRRARCHREVSRRKQRRDIPWSSTARRINSPCCRRAILHPEKLSVIANGVVINPKAFFDELDRIVKRRGPVGGNLLISDRAHVIFPYHMLEEAVLGKRPQRRRHRHNDAGHRHLLPRQSRPDARDPHRRFVPPAVLPRPVDGDYQIQKHDLERPRSRRRPARCRGDLQGVFRVRRAFGAARRQHDGPPAPGNRGRKAAAL